MNTCHTWKINGICAKHAKLLPKCGCVVITIKPSPDLKSLRNISFSRKLFGAKGCFLYSALDIRLQLGNSCVMQAACTLLSEIITNQQVVTIATFKNKPKGREKLITHTCTDVTNTYHREAGGNMFTFVNEKLKTGNVFNTMMNQ